MGHLDSGVEPSRQEKAGKSNETEEPARVSIKPPSTRTPIGAAVISILGILFGMCLTIGGSLVVWRVDPIFGRLSQSGLSANGLIAGDGKITLALGLIGLIAFAAGAFLRRKWLYGIALAASLLILGMAAYEITSTALSPAILKNGAGVYMCLGGGVAGSLCAFGGVTMV